MCAVTVFACVCVCMCHLLSPPVPLCACVRASVHPCVCVCVCARARVCVSLQEYEKEGIDWTKVEFVDNQECVDCIDMQPPKGIGVLAVLDAQCRFPKSTDTSFAQSLKVRKHGDVHTHTNTHTHT